MNPIDELRARAAGETCVPVFDDEGSAVSLRLWFCAARELPLPSRWFRGARLPEPITDLPGEWFTLWREGEGADSDDDGGYALWHALWQSATEKASRYALHLEALRGDDKQRLLDTPRRWLAFCPDGRVLSGDPAQRLPHPAVWRIRCDRAQRLRPCSPLPPRGRSCAPGRRQRNRNWIDSRNRLRAAQAHFPGTQFWSHCLWEDEATHFGGGFPGRRPMVYRFDIETTRHAWAAEIENRAWDEHWAASTPSADDGLSAFRSGNVLIPSYRAERDDPYVYRMLGFDRRPDRRADLERRRIEIAARGGVRVRECAALLDRDPLTRQLRFVVHQPILTRAIIEAAVADFIDRGEQGWIGREDFGFSAADLIG